MVLLRSLMGLFYGVFAALSILDPVPALPESAKAGFRLKIAADGKRHSTI